MSLLNTSISLGRLLRDHPWAEEVLGWHRIDVASLDPRLSLEAACWLVGRSSARLLADLEAAAPDDAPLVWTEAAPDDHFDEEWSPVPTEASFASESYWDAYADDLLTRAT